MKKQGNEFEGRITDASKPKEKAPASTEASTEKAPVGLAPADTGGRQERRIEAGGRGDDQRPGADKTHGDPVPPPQPTASRPWTSVEMQVYSEQTLSQQITSAVLRNPNVEKLCYGDPLQPHRCGDFASVGEYLAHHSMRLARDYLAASKQIAQQRLDELKAQTPSQ